MDIEKKKKESVPKKYQEEKIEEKRSFKKLMRFNKTEWETINKLAKLSDQNLAIYIRNASVLSVEKLIQTSGFYLGVRSEIRKVGVNVNQIARVLNASKDVNDPALKKDLEDIKSSLSIILNKLA